VSKNLVIPEMRTFEDLVDLECGLRTLQALLDHIGRVLELAKSDEVASDKVQNLIISDIALQF